MGGGVAGVLVPIEDFRLKLSFFIHPKTRKLRRRLGEAGPWALVTLMAFAAAEKRDGRLAGLSEEDIGIVAGYEGDPAELVRVLLEVRFLDRDESGTYSIHDWAEHNSYVFGAIERSENARAKANKRWDGDSRATTIPPDFVLTEDMAYYGLVRGLDVKREFEKFGGHAEENQTKHKNWNLAWQHWCRNAVDYYKRDHHGREPVPPPPRPSVATFATEDPIELATRRLEVEQRANIAKFNAAVGKIVGVSATT